jgi:rhodanese-related sulfurtransferase
LSGSARPNLDARGLPQGYPFRADLEVTPRDVKAAMVENSIYLIDCRTQGEFETARISGAKLIPLNELGNSVDQIQADAAGRPVVVHCHMGGRSMKAALFLRGQGVDAKSMAGGIDVWSLDIDSTVPRY